MTLTEAIRLAKARLAASPSGALDAEVLLCHLLGKSRTYLFTWPERLLTDEQERDYLALLERRARGEPVAYITGRREFWSLDLEVNEATLIPRPDTELLVERALLRIPREQGVKVADLGTGSGAIALAVARERPRAHLFASDRSPDALSIARRNRDRLGLTNVELREGAWFAPFEGCRFFAVLSNPPYIRAGDTHLSEGDVRFEPTTALVSGGDGLDDIRHLVHHAPSYLEPEGWLLLEHGYDQGDEVRGLMTARGFVEVTTVNDLGGHPRVTEGRFPGID